MAEPDTSAVTATRPEASDAHATFEALARTLHLEELAELSVSATIRKGTLLAPRLLVPPTRNDVPRAASEGVTLPRLDVALQASTGPDADLSLVRTLGEGGMGVVWLAHQRSLSREVAVKRLKHGAWSSAASSALLDEARATGALEHPSIVPVHALGADADGSPLLVMKRIEGESLDTLLRAPAHDAWPALERRHGDRIAAIVEILMRVADALHLAHARGIVHRDVKPENVMVGSYGEVYLVDWGIALRPALLDEQERTSIGIVGTPSFMAPEMVRGDAGAIDARTDVYLLGATLHAALTGEPRHAGGTLSNVLLAALASKPFAYAAPDEDLGALANRATSQHPNDRPQTALAFREALAAFLRHRASSRLADEAQARLDALALDATAERLASPEATRALTESRFALTQALREWSENDAARRALDRTLRWMIDAELQRRSPDAAEALAAELSTSDAALATKIAALRTELRESRALEDAARREADDRDPLRTAKQRAWISAGLIALTLVLVGLGWSSELSHHGARPMTEALVYDVVWLTFVATVVLVARRRLLANRLGRQTAAALVMVFAAATISDLLLWLRGGDTHQAGSASMLVMASVLGGGAIGIDRRFGWSAAAFLAGAIVCAFFPALTVPSIGAAAIVASSVVLVGALQQLWAARPAPHG